MFLTVPKVFIFVKRTPETTFIAPMVRYSDRTSQRTECVNNDRSTL